MKVDVMVGNTVYHATILNGVWTVTNVVLTQGTNSIWVKAYPIDADCSPVQKDIVITYQPDICPNPITNFTLSSHAAAGQPGDPNLVSTPTVTMTGTIAG